MVQPTSPAPPAPVVRVLGLLTGLGSVAIGVGLVLDAESSFGVVWASLFVVLGVVVLLSFVAVLPVRPRPATTGSVRGAGRDVGRDVVLDGEPAQFHPQPLERVRLAGLAALTLLGGWLVVMGVVGAVEETWLWAVLAAVPAAYLLGFPVLTVLGRARAGGWWLTPTRLVAEHHGLRSEVPLRDVATVTPWSRSVHVAPVEAGRVEHRSLTPWPWRTRARGGDLVVPVGAAGAPPASEDLAALLREAAASAARRAG